MLAGCSHDAETVALVAPFNSETRLGEVSAVWENTGGEREFAEAVRLKQTEVRLQYRASVRNRLHDALFVRLSDFKLVDDHGLEVGTDATSAECTVGAGATEGVLAGEVWVPRRTWSECAGSESRTSRSP